MLKFSDEEKKEIRNALGGVITRLKEMEGGIEIGKYSDIRIDYNPIFDWVMDNGYPIDYKELGFELTIKVLY